jgi:hypothetical protein
MEKIISDLKEPLHYVKLRSEELRELVEIAIQEKKDDWAHVLLREYRRPRSYDENRPVLVPQEIEALKNLVLATQNHSVACYASIELGQSLLLAKRNLSNSDERRDTGVFDTGATKRLKDIAVKTQDAREAYYLLQNLPGILSKNEIFNLEKTVYYMADSSFALEQIQAVVNAPIDEEMDEIKLSRYVEIIIKGNDPRCAYGVLYAAKEWRNIRENTGGKINLPSLHPDNEQKLKRIVIESGSPVWSFYSLSTLDTFSQGERMVLKGNALKVDDPDIACQMLCETDFIPYLNDQERDRVRKLAAKTLDCYLASEALKYIYDLTPEEKANLEKVTKS